MGFDGIAAQTIMFIAVISAASLLVLAFNSEISRTTSSMITKQSALNNQLRTDVNIESVIYNPTTSFLQVYAKNTGKTILRTDLLSIYVNNIYISNSSRNISILPDTNTLNVEYWDPNEVILINISGVGNSNSLNTVSILTQYQTRDTEEFSA